MITITITIKEEDGSLKTIMDPVYDKPTRTEFGMSQIIEKEFKSQQKKLAKKTGGQFVSGK